jgi:hypothetical protein
MWLFFVLFFPPPSVVWFDLLYRVFGRFVQQGEFKNAIKKNRAKISSAPLKNLREKKKIVTYLVAFLASGL